MNRPIKFRAWDKLAKVMLPVQTIDFVNEKLTTGSADATFKEFELMQYAGLKDRNGVEIYEGDIVGYTGFDDKRHKARIIWKEEECRFVAIIKKYKAWFTLSSKTPQGTDTDLEVIGNIYETPELLK